MFSFFQYSLKFLDDIFKMQLMVFCIHNRRFLRMWQLVRCILGQVVELVEVGILELELVGIRVLVRGILK